MSSSSSSDINSRLQVERAVDLKIREFIDNSPSIESKKLNINRLKCFYTAAKTLFFEEPIPTSKQSKLFQHLPSTPLPLLSNNNNSNRKMKDIEYQQIFLLLNTLLYSKVRKNIEDIVNNYNNVYNNPILNKGKTKRKKVDTNQELKILTSMYQEMLNKNRRTDKEMHIFLSKQIFPYMFYAAYVITKEISRKSTFKGEIVIRILELGFGFSHIITKKLKITMEDIVHQNEKYKRNMNEKLNTLKRLNEKLFQQKNSKMKDEFQKQKSLSIMISQVDKKIDERIKKKEEMLNALKAVRKLHKMFLTRNSSKIAEGGRQKLFSEMAKINVANLMINTRQKSKAKERLDFLVGQINNRTNNIYKLINSKLKKELPYAPLKISTATNTSNDDFDDMEFQIIQPSKKIWHKDGKGKSSRGVLRQVSNVDYISYISQEILDKLGTTIELYSKPQRISNAGILSLIFQVYVAYANEKLYSNKEVELDEACYNYFLNKYRIKTITSERLIDFLYSIRKSCAEHGRILIFLKHISKKDVNQMIHSISNSASGIGGALSVAAKDDDDIKIKINKIYRLMKEESIFRYANMLKKLIENQPENDFFVTESGKTYAMAQNVLNCIRNHAPYLPTSSKLKLETNTIKNREEIDVAFTLPKKYHITLEKLITNDNKLKDVIDLDPILELLSYEEENESNVMCVRLCRLFNAADSNRSDDLSFKEFKVLMTSLNPSYKNAEIGALYRMCLEFDAVNNGDTNNVGKSKKKQAFATRKSASMNDIIVNDGATTSTNTDQLLENSVHSSNFVGAMSKIGIMSTTYMQQLASKKIGLFFTTKYNFTVPNISTVQQLNQEWSNYSKSASQMLEYLDVNANTASDAWYVLDNKTRLNHFRRILQLAINGEETFSLAWDTYRLMRFQIETLITARTKLATALGPLRMLIKFKTQGFNEVKADEKKINNLPMSINDNVDNKTS